MLKLFVSNGKTYFDRENKFSKKPYRLVNAKIGYEIKHADIYLYGKKVFDRKYDSDGISGATTAW